MKENELELMLQVCTAIISNFLGMGAYPHAQEGMCDITGILAFIEL